MVLWHAPKNTRRGFEERKKKSKATIVAVHASIGFCQVQRNGIIDQKVVFAPCCYQKKNLTIFGLMLSLGCPKESGNTLLCEKIGENVSK